MPRVFFCSDSGSEADSGEQDQFLALFCPSGQWLGLHFCACRWQVVKNRIQVELQQLQHNDNNCNNNSNMKKNNNNDNMKINNSQHERDQMI